jgi:cell division protein FtsB
MTEKMPRLNKIKHTVNKLLGNSMIVLLFVPVVLTVYLHVLKNSVRSTNETCH